MNKHILAAVAATTLLSACASSPVLDADAKGVPPSRMLAFQTHTSPRQVRVIIIRDSAFFGSACDLGVKIDGTLAGALGSSERAIFWVEPGDHVLTLSAYSGGLCWTPASKGTETHIKPGQDRRYRIVYNQEFSLTPE
ncbi:hypothetical protein [Caballeronia glathei]|uniref:Lipoprotein n=1 Tax=Caballeronia glathei TaxID=60547 RepID=A0A069PKI0_9BURK|nr:hypothetical protein [Caballeronia glathei]KDR37821.1 hypothetical protein BG61_06915 [Caballeronia glathei]